MTVDSLIALLVATMLVMWSSELVSSRTFQRDDILVEYGHDLLAVADKSGALDDVILDKDTRAFKSLISLSPYPVCIQAEIRKQDGTFFYHADNYNDTALTIKYNTTIQTGCLRSGFTGDTKPSAFVKVSRVWVSGKRPVDDSVYSITLELWYKSWKV